MEFAIISPTAGLERYATLSKTHLVLGHISDINYIKFYSDRRAEGDLLILDNGSYENGVPMMSISSIKGYNPQVVVLPDYFLQPWKKTWHAACHFLDVHYENFPSQEWLYIPQAEKGDIHGFLESYTEAVQDPRITWLGIPRALAYAITDDPLMRVTFARMVKREYPRIKLHAFGMVNGDVHELGYLAAAGVNSIDSSAPVWRGWHQVDIHKHILEGFPPVDFSAEYNAQCDCIIKSNLEACGVRISNR